MILSCKTFQNLYFQPPIPISVDQFSNPEVSDAVNQHEKLQNEQIGSHEAKSMTFFRNADTVNILTPGMRRPDDIPMRARRQNVDNKISPENLIIGTNTKDGEIENTEFVPANEEFHPALITSPTQNSSGVGNRSSVSINPGIGTTGADAEPSLTRDGRSDLSFNNNNNGTDDEKENEGAIVPLVGCLSSLYFYCF